jgi:hypothetical protein
MHKKNFPLRAKETTMIDDYGWNSGSPLNADNPTNTEGEKAHWSVRAREGLHKALDLVADHSTTVGMTGTTALLIGAGACAVMGNAAPNEGFALQWYGDAAQYVFGALATMSASLVVEEGARSFLKRDDALELFGPERDDLSQSSPLKGAVVIDDDPTYSPKFKTAVREVLTSLDDKPEAKSALVNLLKKSPEAREAFTKQVTATGDKADDAFNLHKAESHHDVEPGDNQGPAPR